MSEKRNNGRMDSGDDWSVAEMTAQSPSSFGLPEGERKIVTVLFADVVNSSALVEGADPETANNLLLSLIEIMVDAVHRFDGTVNQVLGDGIMAIFGAPRAQEDHALRACLAAETMQTLAKETFWNTARSSAPRIAIRVGINSGEVVTQLIENDLHLDYRAVGETVHMAARMERQSPPGSILVTRRTLDLISSQAMVRPVRSCRLSETSQPVKAFELVRVQPPSDKERIFAARAPACFVGRQPDLAGLNAGLQRMLGGHGEIQVITGDVGVGKSRLIGQFVSLSESEQLDIVRCDLLPFGSSRQQEPVARILRCLLKLEEQGSRAALRDAVRGLVGSLDIRDDHAVDALLDVLCPGGGGPTWRLLDPRERVHLRVRVVTNLIGRLSQFAPLLLVFDDFQWADTETRALLAELAQSIASTRVLVVVSSRLNKGHPWQAWGHYREHRVKPLSLAESRALLDALLGPDRSLEGLKDQLADRTEGVPFFIEECVKALEDAGLFQGTRGAYRMVVPAATVRIPATVWTTLAARIDSLSRADRFVLLCASVVGQRIGVGLLRDLTGVPFKSLLLHLGRLQKAGFLRRVRILPNLEFSFKHALIHDVAYGTLLKAHRCQLHRTLLASVRKQRASELPDRSDLLAHHAVRAGLPAQAYGYCRRAGVEAQAKSRNWEAARLFEDCLSVLGDLPATRRNRERKVDVILDQVQSLLAQGRHDGAEAKLEEAERLAGNLCDPARRGKVASLQTLHHWITGDLESAITVARTSTDFAAESDDFELEMLTSGRLGALLVDRGDYETAVKLFRSTIPKIRPNLVTKRFGLLPVAAVGFRATLARALGELGRFKEAVQVGDEGITIADEIGHGFSQVYANLYVGNAFLRKGDFERSLPLLQRCHELCDVKGSKLLLPLSAASLGYAYTQIGDTGRGVRLMEEGIGAARELGLVFQLSQQLAWQGEAYLARQAGDQALRSANLALALARQHGEKGDEAWALWLLGKILNASAERAPGQPDERALGYLREAQELAEARRMIPLLAHCHLELGKYSRRIAAPRPALRDFDTAISYYRNAGMDYWSNRAAAVKQGDEVRSELWAV